MDSRTVVWSRIDCQNISSFMFFSIFRACVSFGPRNRSIGAAAKSQVWFFLKWWTDKLKERMLLLFFIPQYSYRTKQLWQYTLAYACVSPNQSPYQFLLPSNRLSQTPKTQSKVSRGFMAGPFQIPSCNASKTTWCTTLYKCPQEQRASRWEGNRQDS